MQHPTLVEYVKPAIVLVCTPKQHLLFGKGRGGECGKSIYFFADHSVLMITQQKPDIIVFVTLHVQKYYL